MPKQDSNKKQQTKSLDEVTVQAIKVGLKSEENGDFRTMDQAVRFVKSQRK